MLAGTPKQPQAWKPQAYPVPTPTQRGLRWKASVLRTLHRWNGLPVSAHPATIMIPALYNLMPAESVALGWLNEIDALVTMRQRMNCAARITGWDVFTFHTLHNADHFFDTTIRAVHDTWVKEGNLCPQAVQETRRQFGKPQDYHRIHARLVENLVFQASLLDWVIGHAADAPLRFHVIGTALLSALVSTRAITFGAAVESATKFGSRWDKTLRDMANGKTEEEIGWTEFGQIRNLMEGRTALSMEGHAALNVSRQDLPVPDAPVRPFWYSATVNSDPMLITTAQEAANALETMNLSSWSCVLPNPATNAEEPVRGWLVSALHPMARLCRWSVSNYLLATPPSVTLFLDHIATLGRVPLQAPTGDPLQNRLRLSRMKVTGP
jgi:hypothetical protein